METTVRIALLQESSCNLATRFIVDAPLAAPKPVHI